MMEDACGDWAGLDLVLAEGVLVVVLRGPRWCVAGEKRHHYAPTSGTVVLHTTHGLRLLGTSLVVCLAFRVAHFRAFDLARMIKPFVIEMEPKQWLPNMIQMNTLLAECTCRSMEARIAQKWHKHGTGCSSARTL